MNAAGIDVSSRKSTVAVLRPFGEVVKLPFEVHQNAEDLAALAAHLKSIEGETRVVMEHTGRYYESVAKVLHEAGLYVAAVNPLLIKEYGNNSLRKVKTDKADAMKIAKYALDNWTELRDYCAREDKTLKELEANLHITDDPEEIAIGTLKTACDFYDGDWAGILSVDMDLGLWTPVWWYKVGRPDHTQMLLHEFESFESMPSWIQAMQENEIIILPDTSSVKESLPGEYEAYQHLRANSLLAAPFKPNPVGFLVIRNPKRYVDQPGMMVFLAYVLHLAMAQKKTMDSAKMTISPENITKDTDVIIHLLGNLDIYTSKGVIREADFKSPMICKMIAYLALHPKTLMPPRKLVSVLWPDSQEDVDTLSKNVRYLLYRFRQVFSLISDQQLIESSASGYRLNPELNIMTDLQLFDQYRSSIQDTASRVHKVELLKKAVELYEGHVFSYDNSEDWVMPIATNYALIYVGVVNELLKILAEAKDYSEVVQYAARALEIEPGNMRAHYWRIFALYQTGATEMVAASLPMAKRSLTEEEYRDLIVLLRQMKRRYPVESDFSGDFDP